ncbi:MAG: hypothetical protein IIB05_10935 [Bacteroidetes bacterium]|nr:hypothetical protein [Bacteroidota bacterium]
MQFSGTIHLLPKNVKVFIALFLIAISCGYFTGLSFLTRTTSLMPDGIEKHYIGNEDEEDAGEMIFKKSEREILNIIHTHVLSFSLIFFALGSILITTSVNQKLKTFLLIEPFVSIILTFGGIWILWKEILWFKYVILFSGILLTTSFILIVCLIFWQLIFVRGE